MIDNHYRSNIESDHKLSSERKKRVMFVFFDEFVTNPMPICEVAAKFIGTKITPRTKNTLKRERCPRTLLPEEKRRKRELLEQGSSDKCCKILDDLIHDYHAFFQNSKQL
jgi:hypothetical protein